MREVLVGCARSCLDARWWSGRVLVAFGALGPFMAHTLCVPRTGCTLCKVFAVYARACTDALALGTSGHWSGSAEVGEEPVTGGGARRFDRRTE